MIASIRLYHAPADSLMQASLWLTLHLRIQPYLHPLILYRLIIVVNTLANNTLFRLECFQRFFQRPNRTVHFDIETRCKIRNLKRSQP